MDETKRIQELENKLRQAIEDIPHVGNKCAHLERNSRGYCKVDGGICCYRVHTGCSNWEWRGEA